MAHIECAICGAEATRPGFNLQEDLCDKHAERICACGQYVIPDGCFRSLDSTDGRIETVHAMMRCYYHTDETGARLVQCIIVERAS